MQNFRLVLQAFASGADSIYPQQTARDDCEFECASRVPEAGSNSVVYHLVLAHVDKLTLEVLFVYIEKRTLCARSEP